MLDSAGSPASERVECGRRSSILPPRWRKQRMKLKLLEKVGQARNDGRGEKDAQLCPSGPVCICQVQLKLFPGSQEPQPRAFDSS